MDKSQIHLGDWHRLLFGNAPAGFMAETLFRAIIIYICLMVIVGWLGKRMSGQVTITELGIAIMLGAIVAPPMETPERGILYGVFILIVMLLLHRSTASLTVRHPKAEKIIQGSLDICVKNGVMQVDVLRKIRVSRAQIFASLRMNNIFNLGQVERLYMEANGAFSMFKAERPRPGLSVLPPDDDAVHGIQQRPDGELKACTSCGATTRLSDPAEVCKHCGHSSWDTAVI